MGVREDLIDWLDAREPWQRDLARRLCDRVELEDGDVDEVAAIVKKAHGVDVLAPEANFVELDDLPATVADGDCPKLVRFGPVRGLGALTENAELRFATGGLTIVYGPNAVGKSTYVSGLKCVCRTVDRESAIRGNVFADEPGPSPTAALEFEGPGGLTGLTVDLQDSGAIPLDTISIFDAKCAELYLDERNAVAFVPEELRLLTRMARAQTHLRERLGAEVRSLREQQPTFPGVGSATQAGATLASLTSDSDLAELRSLGSLQPEEVRRRDELRSLITSAASVAAQADASAATTDAEQAASLAARLKSLVGRTTDQELAKVAALAGDAATSATAVELAAAEFSDAPVQKVGSEPWRLMWEAARSFADASDSQFPPGPGSPCQLCLQSVEEDAAGRMAAFQAHVRGAAQGTADAANRRLRDALGAYDMGEIEQCRTSFMASLSERSPELHAALSGLLDSLAAAFAEVQTTPSEPPTVQVDVAAADQLEEWGERRGLRAEEMCAAVDPTASAELRAELRELEDRNYLGEHIDEVEAWINRMGVIAALENARASLATNSLTMKQTELSETVVTEEFTGRLRDELEALRCALPVSVSPHTSVGEAQVRLRLAGSEVPAVSEIASEGEHRAVALAFFFAESAMGNRNGGLVLDDPVSSLDDDRREYIAARIVDEAHDRQVVVFTHDLAFMLELEQRATDGQLELGVQALWRFGGDIGRVDDHPPFKAMNLRRRVGVLTTAVQEWDSQAPPSDFDDAWRRVCDFYARMRTAWERAVEERLFRGVVQRFQREIKTLKLPEVSISPEQLSAIEEGMTRCSAFVHDEPPGAGTALPGRTDLAADLELLREFEESTRS